MKIGRESAIQFFLVSRKKSQDVISRIENWDTEKSVKENAADIGIEYNAAGMLARMFRLPHA